MSFNWKDNKKDRRVFVHLTCSTDLKVIEGVHGLGKLMDIN